jgi:predicted MFS family arabinose efflux permease
MIMLRMGVATGEAGSVPASHSMIADMFPPHRRPMAYAVWALSNPVGSTLAFLVGGWLAYLIGWRATLIVVGVGSLIFVPFLLMMKEPLRGRFDDPGAQRGHIPLGVAAKTIFGSPTLVWVLVAAGLHCYVMMAVQSWTVPFYSRVFGLPIEKLAVYLAIAVGLAGGLGAIGAGYLMHRLGKRSLRWYVLVPAIADIVLIPLVLTQFLVDDAIVSLIVGFATSVTITMWAVCATTTTQLVMPPAVRATASAALTFVTNSFGLALGPTVTGFVSDQLAANFGLQNESLRYAILTSLLVAPFASIAFFRAAHHLGRLTPARTTADTTG